jgi:hypothetical protein
MDMKKSRLDLLRQAAAVPEDVTTLDHEHLAEVVRLSGAILDAAGGEVRRRHSEAQAASRQAWEARRKRMKDQAEAAERERIQAAADEQAAALAAQQQRDDEEAAAAQAAIRAVGLKAVRAFSHPR